MSENFVSVGEFRDLCYQAPENAHIFVWNEEERSWDPVVALLAKGGTLRLITDGPLPYTAGEIEDEPELDEISSAEPISRLDDGWIECDAIWYEEIDNAVYIQ